MFSKVSKILELLGGFAIIVSLILLIVELRENRAALDRTIATDRAQLVQSPFLENPILVKALIKLDHSRFSRPGDLQRKYMDLYGMDEDEATVWARFMLLNWELMYADWKYYGNDDIDLNDRIRLLLSAEDQQIAWALYSEVGLWSDKFIAHCESIVTDIPFEWIPKCGYNMERCESRE